LSALLDHVVEDMTFEFSERAQGIRVVRRRPPVFIRGDAALLRRAVENVLRNALFYTPEHTAVEVIVDHDGPSARLLIRDHGPGVPEAALPQLFDPFFRVDEARARNTGGTGLGLTIARRAVVLHGGTIEASNARPSGLTVRIMLPAADGLSQTAREALHVLG
jgi:signal transduction histidine kinase